MIIDTGATARRWGPIRPFDRAGGTNGTRASLLYNDGEDPPSTGFQILFTSAYRYRMRGLVAWVLAPSIVIVFSMVLLVARTASAFAQRRTLDHTIAELDGRVPGLMETYDVPGLAVALVEGGVVVWSNAYGYSDVEATRPMTVDAVVRAESISKSVTAWGIMTLVERGLLDLDDPVTSHLRTWALPDTVFPEEDLTIRQLLSHTGGMPLGTIGVHYSPYGDVPSLREDLSQQARLVREPGASFSYSNVGFDLLELVVEEVTGEEFARYMAREVLQPLGMADSSFTWRESFTASVPTGYDLEGDPVPPYVYPAKGSGGLFATVEDLGRFVSAGMTGGPSSGSPVLQPGSIEQLYTPTTEISGLFRFVAPSYGLGHFIETLSSGERVVWHGGQGNGWMTDFHAIPETGDGIVIVTNSQRSWPLIASVLLMWTQGIDRGPVGFSIIVGATTGMWVLIGLLLAASLVQLLRIGGGLRSGRRSLTPLAPRSRVLRIAQTLTAVVLVGMLVWSTSQDYSFVSSIFPTASPWLGFAMACLAVVLLASAATPMTDSPPRGSGRAPRERRSHDHIDSSASVS